nr:MAG TPA: hypothetical protein [Caudoviricetes sp.]
MRRRRTRTSSYGPFPARLSLIIRTLQLIS